MKKIKFVLLLSVSIGTSSLCYGQLVDPTRPANYVPGTQQSAGNTIQVNAILTASGRYLAVVNGILLKQGEFVNNYQIVAIQPHAVVFRGAEGKFVKHIVYPKVKYPLGRKTVGMKPRNRVSDEIIQ